MYTPTDYERRHGFTTPDDPAVEVPGEATLERLGITADEFVTTARKMIAEGEWKPAERPSAFSERDAKPGETVVYHGHAIEIPSVPVLLSCGTDAPTYLATQKRLVDRGVFGEAPSGERVSHAGKAIEIPPAETLRVLGLTAGEFVATQKKMIDEGAL